MPPPRTAPLVVVGASAGGVEALTALVRQLPPELPAAVCVVLHLPANSASALAGILDRAGPLTAREARDGDPLVPGRVLVAPPDRHLVVTDGSVMLTRGPRENGHRPAVDVLFRSAARARDGSVVGVVLSGALDDGAAGLVAVTARGGTAVVQEPTDALHPGMPLAALAAAPGAHRAVVADLGALVASVVHDVVRRTDGDAVTGAAGADRGDGAAAAGAPPALPALTEDELLERETAIASMDPGVMHAVDRPGTPVGLGCPDCAGALYGVEEGPLVRYRCRVGHAWSPEALLAEQGLALEGALWMALRGLEDKAGVASDLALRAELAGHHHSARRFRESADDAHEAAEQVRLLLDRMGASGRLDEDA